MLIEVHKIHFCSKGYSKYPFINLVFETDYNFCMKPINLMLFNINKYDI